MCAVQATGLSVEADRGHNGGTRVAAVAVPGPGWVTATGGESALRRLMKPLPARLLAAFLGVALAGVTSGGLPPPGRGGAGVCGMACAGTARCCCRPAAGPRAASATRGSEPSLRAISGGPACPRGCAAALSGTAIPGGPSPRDDKSLIPPAPAALLPAFSSFAPERTRLARAIRPRAPPVPRRLA